jgi:very-short-patch-repair endonuclease
MKKKYRDKNWLFQKYVVDEYPATEIAEMAGCHFSTIYYWLEKFEIQIRDQSEARIVVFKNPEKRKQRAQNQANLWKDPAYRQNQMKVRNSQEFHDKQSQIIQRIWQDPDYYELQCEASRRLWQDPEYRAKTLPALLERWDDPEYVQAHQDRLEKLWSDPDYRQMMSEKASSLMKELWRDPEFRQNKAEEMSKRVLELWETPEFQAIQSEKASREMTERWKDSDWQAKMSRAATELWRDPEHRKMMSNILIERWKDPEWREFFSSFMVDQWQDSEYRETMLAYLQSPERRDQHGELMQKLWQDPDFVNKIALDRVGKIRSGYRTDIEAITEEALQQHDIDYEFEYRVGRYSVDFYLPQYKIALECDGEYWHRNREDEDAKRDEYLEERGLTVVRFFGPDIRADIRSLFDIKLLPLLG